MSTFNENRVPLRCCHSIVAKATIIKTEKELFQKQRRIDETISPFLSRIALGVF